MGDDLNPLKRPRTQDASPSDSIVDVKKHPSLYLSDGNIVLYSAASEGEAVAFCVHRSMLSKVSLIFADMFSLPPSDVNEQHEGRPVVRMQDRASDLEQLLKILYHESSLPLKRLDPQFPSEVKPILQLANKYEITSLRGQIVSRLTEDWPTTLREWDALEKDIATMRETWDERVDYTASGSDFSLDSHLPEPVGALHLAKECEVPQILPAVFYHLSRLSLRWGPDGCESDKASQRIYARLGIRTARWKSLSGEEFYAVLAGKINMKAAAVQLLNTFPSYFHGPEMQEASLCHPTFPDCRLFMQSLTRCFFDGSDECDILAVLKQRYENLDVEEIYPGMCGECRDGFRERIKEIRVFLWEHTPRFFGI